jgi:hypothetical protein
MIWDAGGSDKKDPCRDNITYFIPLQRDETETLSKYINGLNVLGRRFCVYQFQYLMLYTFILFYILGKDERGS